MTTTIKYNERTWAIDLISEINNLCVTGQMNIKHAGGEHTLHHRGGRLFPDVLLFSDMEGMSVLQGWELKMPDTAITDTELLSNAEKKARQMGLNSFLVWNVNEAALFVQSEDDNFKHYHAWEPLDIHTRDEVQARQSEWKRLLENILKDINQFLKDGQILSQISIVDMSEKLFADVVTKHAGGVASEITSTCQKDALLHAEIDDWWAVHKAEHAKSTQAHHVLAQNNIISWLNRILFAHYLKLSSDAAKQVELIGEGASVADAIFIFEEISSKCDFMNIFKPALAQTCLSEEVWRDIVAINIFFTSTRLESLDQGVFHQLVERALLTSHRKIAGQFSTPKPLADLLVRITVNDKNKHVLDPCCGTGTIARSCYQLKREFGVDPKRSIASTWAADKFSFSLQLASIALSHPDIMGEIIRIFQQDLFNLSLPASLSFTDPENGAKTTQALPKVHAIVSNLPFVRFETLVKLNPEAKAFGESLNATLGNGRLTAKVDLYAYAILKLWDLLENDGKAGLIISNAWLGASWGTGFRAAVLRYFKIDSVIISGAGRWFDNADVVTTVLCLSKRAEVIDVPENEEEITFVQVNTPIQTWAEEGKVKQISNSVILKKSCNDCVSVRRRSLKSIDDLEMMGMSWNAMFSDLEWASLLKTKLIPISKVFRAISRGKKLDQNAPFYPLDRHGIESEYLQPLLKTPRSIKGLIAAPDSKVFCCSDDWSLIQQGARRWLQKFEPTMRKYATPTRYWYDQRLSKKAGLVLSINWDKRLFVARLQEPVVIDQRFICFITGELDSLDIIHALLNTTLGLFLIESVGFGKGLGALDLNATNIKNKLHMLDPSQLQERQMQSILDAFEPLLQRDVLNFREELEQEDRIKFDKTVLKCFGLEGFQKDISNALLVLVNMRQAVRDE